MMQKQGGARALWSALALAGLSSAAVAQTTTTVTRVVAYEYDAFGQVSKETDQPDDATLRVVTTYTRTPVNGVDFGLISAKTLTWLDPASGTTPPPLPVQSLTYDTQGRFALTETNALAQTITRSYDPATGVVLSQRDIDQLTTSWQDDAWGRKTRETRPDGTATSLAYQQCVDSCDWAVSVVVTQQWQGTNQITVPSEGFTDRRGRTTQTRTWGFDGTAVVTQTTFDANGYTSTVARPRFQGAASVLTSYFRDAIGRVNRIQSPAPDGSGYANTTYIYDGRTLTMTDAKGHTRVEEHNGLGKIKAATDALGQTTTYVYDGFGNLVRTRDPLGNEIAIGYDAMGHKTSLQDPDLGTVSYSVDPLGRTWKQQDAKGQLTTFTYDKVNRLVRRLEPDQDSRWDYDTAVNGVGKLAESYTWVSGAKDVRRVQTYDALGRPDTTVLSLDWDYVTQTSYDGFGRANVQSYTRRTKGATSGGVTTAIVNTFNAQGYTDKTYRRSDGVDTLVWQGLAIDAEGRDTLEQIGTTARVVHGYNANTGRLESIASGPPSGSTVNPTLQDDLYQYDILGNLAYRAQLNGVGTLLQETFDYDELNRLKDSYLGSQTQAFAYDALGNITSKANVGAYAYPSPGYGAVRPHAVGGITGNVAGLTNPAFSYDGNGNLVNGLNRAYTWSAADQPLTIDKFASGVAVQRTEFVYGPDHERLRDVVRTMTGGQPQAMVNTVVYAGAIQKEIDVDKGVTIIRTSLGADGYVEERITGTAIDPNTAGVRNARFFLKDHLGSTIGIVDEGGNLLQRMSYDAWGRRRNLDGSDDSWSSLGTIKNDQDNSGYTGHEQLDQLGLVDMNARFYDPITGRHISGDPTVPDPMNQQAFNRFSYVLNNALLFTDPTGLGPEAMFTTLSNPFWPFANQKNEQDRRCDQGNCDEPKANELDREREAELKQRMRVNAAKANKANEEAEGTDSANSEGICVGTCPAQGAKVVVGIDAGGVYINPKAENAGIVGFIASLFIPVAGEERVAAEVVAGTKGEGIFAKLFQKLTGCGCFVSGTPVATDHGDVPIEQIRVGTIVIARNGATGKLEPKPVTHLFHFQGREIYSLVLLDEERKVERIEVTDDHPFMVLGRGWVKLIDLRAGMRIDSMTHRALSVAHVQDLKRTDATYNLEVADDHTFYAGEAHALVHNGPCPFKTIIEESGAVKKADALTGRKAEAYEKIKDALAQGKAGGNQHALKGDLAGKSAIDLGGSGKGRGAERVIFSTDNDVVTIHDIVDYHK